MPSHRSTLAFLPKVIEATITVLPFSCLFSGARTLPPLGEDVVAARRVRPSRPASACSFSTLRLSLGIAPKFRCGVHLFIPLYAIGPIPNFWGHATAYRWRSLPRVRRHRVSSPQGSSRNGCCLCMDQLMCASLFPYPLLLEWSRHVECVGGDLIRVKLYGHS